MVQYLRELRPCHRTAARGPRLPPVALQQDKAPLVRLVVVEPAGPHDGVGQAAGTNQAFAAALPVMRALAVRDPDGRHEVDPNAVAVQGREHVADAAIVHRFRARHAAAGRAVGKHDGIDPVHGGTERAWLGEVADDDLHGGRCFR